MEWIKSGRCDSNHCLETAFQRSSYCENSACLEAAYQKSSYCFDNACLEAAYQKSSRSHQDSCLEAAYRKSSRSANGHGACLEAAYRGRVLVRDSKLLDKVTGEYHGPILNFGPGDWQMFLGNLPAKP